MPGAGRIDRRRRILRDRIDPVNRGGLAAGVPVVDLGRDDVDVTDAFQRRTERDPALPATHISVVFRRGSAAVQQDVAPRSVADGGRGVDDSREGEIAEKRIDEPARLDRHELPDAPRRDRPFQPAVGPQISIGPEHPGDDDHLAPHRDDNFARLDQHSDVVPGQRAHRIVKIALARWVGGCRRDSGGGGAGRWRRRDEDVFARRIDAG